MDDGPGPRGRPAGIPGPLGTASDGARASASVDPDAEKARTSHAVHAVAASEPEADGAGETETRAGRSVETRVAAELRAIGAALGLSAFCVVLANLLPRWSLQHLRVWLLRAAGCRIARRASFLGDVVLIGPPGAATRLEVGEGCIIGPGVTFGLDASVLLGRNVSVGPGPRSTRAHTTSGGRAAGWMRASSRGPW